MKVPTIAERTHAAYEALPEPQRAVFEAAFRSECELAQAYRRFGMRDDPLAKGAQWRWMPHADLRDNLKKRGVTKSVGDAYQALAAVGLIDHREEHPGGADTDSNHTIRLTTAGRALGRKLWPKTPGGYTRNNYAGYGTYHEMVAAHLEAPGGPEDLREWLLDEPRKGMAGLIQKSRYLVPETGEYLWIPTTLTEWLRHTFGSDRYLTVGYDRWSYVAGISARYQDLPAWAVRFQRRASELLSERKEMRYAVPMAVAVARIALTLAENERLPRDAFCVPTDRLAMVDFAVMADGAVHALYPNQYKAYTACDQYVSVDQIHFRGRCRELAAFLALAPLAADWKRQLSPCPDCLEMIARQVGSGAQGNRAFVTVAQLEDARVPIDLTEVITEMLLERGK